MDVLTRTRALEIDRSSKKVLVENLVSKEQYYLEYEKWFWPSEAGLSVSESGAIKVDKYLRTSETDLRG